MKNKIAITWFRQDLRLTDNRALMHAATHDKILPIYILDDENAKEYAMGSASRWWLHYSLKALNSSLDNHLCVYKGNPQDIFDEILTKFDVEAVYWNRCYEPWRIHRDKAIKSKLKSQNIHVHTYNGSLLWEPWNIKKSDGTPYKVFTPFYRRGCLSYEEPELPIPRPINMSFVLDDGQIGIDALDLRPQIPWDLPLEKHWNIGEVAAKKRFNIFIEEGLLNYKKGRDYPAEPFVSRLSPHLHFGEISPNQLWHATKSIGQNVNTEHFCSELAWREFSYSLLYHNPELPNKNLQSKFDSFPWIENERYLRAWQKGETGIPLVGAGMRELWQTGYMHNRSRMIVGSLLVKNLRLHWHHGERWFWDKLVDADLANNSASWQSIAGCGADAAPYFRIFNPVTQGQRFDPQGKYIRQFIPEIAALPDKYLFCPWAAPEHILQASNIKLGVTYPKPIVDLKLSREAALDAFQSLKTR